MNKDTKKQTTNRIKGDHLREALLLTSSFQSYPMKPKLYEIDLQKEGSGSEDSSATNGDLAGSTGVAVDWASGLVIVLVR
jgi:hypothetical protein